MYCCCVDWSAMWIQRLRSRVPGRRQRWSYTEVVSTVVAISGTWKRRIRSELVAIVDASLCQIVWRHFERDTIPGKNTYAILLEPPGRIGPNLEAILQGDTKAVIRKDFRNLSAKFHQFFFSQGRSFLIQRVPRGSVEWVAACRCGDGCRRMCATALSPALRAACLALASVWCVACRIETLATMRSAPSLYSEIM